MLSKFTCLSVILCTVFCCAFVSCGKRCMDNFELLRAEALMDVFPDSSYHILCSLSPDGLPKSEQMFYTLLLAEAIDKNMFSLLSCDSLLDEAIQYYGCGINCAKALLYKERILSGMNMKEEAMKYCFEALRELTGNNKEELKVEGMLYEDLGNLYLNQSLLDDGVDMFRKAEISFAGCGYVSGISSVKCNIGWCFLLEGDTVNARKCMKHSIIPVRSRQDSVLISSIYHNLSCTYEDVDSILFYAKQALEFDSKASMKSAILVGYAYLNKELADSAEYYFKQALTDPDIHTRALTVYGLKDLMETKEEYQLALNYFNDYSVLMDSIYFLRESSELERKSYEYMAEFRFYKDRIRIKAWAVSICLIVVFLFSGIILRILYLRRMRRLQYERNEAALSAEVSEMQYRMAILRKQHKEDKELLSQKQLELQQVSDEKARLCNVIFMETQIYQRIKSLSSQKKGKKKADLQILLGEEQVQLRAVINRIYKDYIDHLKKSYPQYTDDDCLFACLSLLDFDDFTLALCFGNFDTRIVIQRRYRIKKKKGEILKEQIVTND